MTDYFFDSRGLTKRYIFETGTGWVQGTIAPGTGNTIFIAQITPVEVMSAVSRHKRDKNISPRTARAIRLLLNRHTVREYQVIYLDDPIIQHAQDLLDTHSLRAFDAVQLATALAINLRLWINQLECFVSDSGLKPTAEPEIRRILFVFSISTRGHVFRDLRFSRHPPHNCCYQ